MLQSDYSFKDLCIADAVVWCPNRLIFDPKWQGFNLYFYMYLFYYTRFILGKVGKQIWPHDWTGFREQMIAWGVTECVFVWEPAYETKLTFRGKQQRLPVAVISSRNRHLLQWLEIMSAETHCDKHIQNRHTSASSRWSCNHLSLSEMTSTQHFVFPFRCFSLSFCTLTRGSFLVFSFIVSTYFRMIYSLFLYLYFYYV